MIILNKNILKQMIEVLDEHPEKAFDVVAFNDIAEKSDFNKDNTWQNVYSILPLISEDDVIQNNSHRSDLIQQIKDLSDEFNFELTFHAVRVAHARGVMPLTNQNLAKMIKLILNGDSIYTRSVAQIK